jgi:hypothetical protein
MTCPTATSTPPAGPIPSLICACATALHAREDVQNRIGALLLAPPPPWSLTLLQHPEVPPPERAALVYLAYPGCRGKDTYEGGGVKPLPTAVWYMNSNASQEQYIGELFLYDTDEQDKHEVIQREYPDSMQLGYLRWG